MHTMQRDTGRHAGGFVIEQLLIVLIIVGLLVPITVSALKVAEKTLTFTEEIQDEIALSQLRKILMIGDEYQIRTDCLQFEYQGADSEISLVNRHLILQPGTQIFLSEIDNAAFLERDGVIMMQYARGERHYERALVHE